MRAGTTDPFEIIALAGWTADRNERAMHGARQLGRRIASATGRPLVEVGAPEPARHRPWSEALEHARPHLREVARAVDHAVRRGPALVVANRCAAAVATIGAALAACPGLAVLYLDAQADFNTPETTPSQYLGGMVISALCGLWDSGHGAGLTTGRLVLAGARDIDPGERVLLDEHGVRVRDVRDPRAIADRLRGRPVWIHVDLDVLEPGEIPTEYRVPGGPSLDELRGVLAEVAAAADVRALEIAEYELEPEQAELHMARIEHLIEPVLTQWDERATRA